MPNHYSPHKLYFKEAHALADLQGIVQDLEWVICAANLYIKLEHSASVEKEAIYFAALAKYGRCFKTGVRRRISEEIVERASADQREAHDYLINMRDKFIAHSVNEHEENYTVAYIKNAATQTPEFSSVQIQHHRTVYMGDRAMESFSQICTFWKDQVVGLITEEKKVVERIAKQIPVSKIISDASGDMMLASPKAGDEAKRRKQRIL